MINKDLVPRMPPKNCEKNKTIAVYISISWKQGFHYRDTDSYKIRNKRTKIYPYTNINSVCFIANSKIHLRKEFR